MSIDNKNTRFSLTKCTESFVLVPAWAPLKERNSRQFINENNDNI